MVDFLSFVTLALSLLGLIGIAVASFLLDPPEAKYFSFKLSEEASVRRLEILATVLFWITAIPLSALVSLLILDTIT